MRRILTLVLAASVLAGCSYFGIETATKPILNPTDCQWHKEDHWIKVHWSYIKNPDGTITAKGFVEPQDPRKSLHTVKLMLAGIDNGGEVVSQATGEPEDTYISGPNAQSEFEITMTPSGNERRYTITGTYHFYLFGTQPDFTIQSRGEISLDPPR